MHHSSHDTYVLLLTVYNTFHLSALQDASHAQKQVEREKEVGLLSDANVALYDNSELAKLGLDIIENYVKAYLRLHFPNLPEGIR